MQEANEFQKWCWRHKKVRDRKRHPTGNTENLSEKKNWRNVWVRQNYVVSDKIASVLDECAELYRTSIKWWIIDMWDIFLRCIFFPMNRYRAWTHSGTGAKFWKNQIIPYAIAFKYKNDNGKASASITTMPRRYANGRRYLPIVPERWPWTSSTMAPSL